MTVQGRVGGPVKSPNLAFKSLLVGRSQMFEQSRAIASLTFRGQLGARPPLSASPRTCPTLQRPVPVRPDFLASLPSPYPCLPAEPTERPRFFAA